MKTIVFIGHEASRSGAPFTQLHLMRWLKKHTAHKLVLVLLKGGELLPEFSELAEVYLVNTPSFPLHQRVWSKLNRLGGREHSNTLNRIAAYAPDVLFASSLLAINYGLQLKQATGAKLICNIHELEFAFIYGPSGGYSAALEQADWLMMGSHAVKEYYLNNFAVDAAKVSVIYDFIADETPALSAPADIRKRYSIPASAVLVGAMGSLHWRKGYDVFAYVARQVLAQSADAYFMWVGGTTTSAEFKLLEREVRLLGLTDRVILAGEQADISSYYNAFDVFLLTSREDPFPLVCLEAALANTPIVCFEQAGGMPEFVRHDAGYVVDYLAIDQMAEKTLLLLGNEGLRKRMGAVGRERALRQHTISQLGPSILALIEGV